MNKSSPEDSLSNFNDFVTKELNTKIKEYLRESFALSADQFHFMEQAVRKDLADRIAGQYVHNLNIEVYQNVHKWEQVTATHEEPKTWFQAFKKECFPKWFLEKFPVKTMVTVYRKNVPVEINTPLPRKWVSALDRVLAGRPSFDKYLYEFLQESRKLSDLKESFRNTTSIAKRTGVPETLLDKLKTARNIKMFQKGYHISREAVLAELEKFINELEDKAE